MAPSVQTPGTLLQCTDPRHTQDEPHGFIQAIHQPPGFALLPPAFPASLQQQNNPFINCSQLLLKSHLILPTLKLLLVKISPEAPDLALNHRAGNDFSVFNPLHLQFF